MSIDLRRHWTSLLGALLVVAAFLTLFHYSLDQGWITDTMKIGAGLLAGAGLGLGGLGLAAKANRTTGEIVIGLGTSLLYATFSFAGIYFGIWSSSTVLVGMIAVTAALCAYAYRRDSRLLMNISLAGALLSPMLLQPETDQVLTLFFYLLVLNAAYFLMSIGKRWSELRIVPFFGSWLLYAVYFVLFDPPVEGLWSLPLRYALAAFAFYLVGFLVSSWKNNRCFDGWNLYLSLTNGVLFGFWAILILHGDLHYAYILGAMGLVYLASGLLVLRLTSRIGTASGAPLAGGALLLLLAAVNAGEGSAMEPLWQVILWGTVSAVLAAFGRKRGQARWVQAAAVIWLLVGIYWYIVTWSTPRGEWFGVFLPFLNTGAAAWMLLCALGFYFSTQRMDTRITPRDQAALSNLFALLSHLVVGGLLTVQIQSTFLEYAADADPLLEDLTLSVVWGIYALLLFAWGAYRRQPLFRWFGSAVLLFVALKAIFLDLDGEQALYKAMVLLALGGVSFLATWINGKRAPAKVKEPDAAEG